MCFAQQNIIRVELNHIVNLLSDQMVVHFEGTVIKYRSIALVKRAL